MKWNLMTQLLFCPCRVSFFMNVPNIQSPHVLGADNYINVRNILTPLSMCFAQSWLKIPQNNIYKYILLTSFSHINCLLWSSTFQGGVLVQTRILGSRIQVIQIKITQEKLKWSYSLVVEFYDSVLLFNN